MVEPNMRARLSQLHRTESEWDRLSNFTPFFGELVIFDPDEQHPFARIKIGDGKTLLKELPFCVDSIISDYFKDHITDGIIDAGRITDYKN